MESRSSLGPEGLPKLDADKPLWYFEDPAVVFRTDEAPSLSYSAAAAGAGSAVVQAPAAPVEVQDDSGEFQAANVDPQAPPAPGVFQELAIPTAAGSVDGQLYQYNAELAVPFDQAKGVIYWLKIVALDDHLADDPLAIQWGWHDRDYGIFDPLAAPVVPGERLKIGRAHV